MSGKAMTQQTYLPEQTAELGIALSFLAAHEGRLGEVLTPRYLLVGADENDRVEVPAAVHRVLRQVVEALRAGKAVTVVPQSMTPHYTAGRGSARGQPAHGGPAHRQRRAGG